VGVVGWRVRQLGCWVLTVVMQWSVLVRLLGACGGEGFECAWSGYGVPHPIPAVGCYGMGPRPNVCPKQ